MPTNLGAHAPKLAELRSLLTKDGRRAAGRFAVDGPTMLGEALDAGVMPEAVFAVPEALQRLGTLAERLTCPVYTTDPKSLARASSLESPPGTIAVFGIRTSPVDDLLSGEPALVLAGISDPGNAGTLLRTAELFGIPSAISLTGGVELYNPKVVRATMGAIFRLGLCEVTGDVLAAAARARGYTIVATAIDGTPLEDQIWERKSLIAIGSERHGVDAWLPTTDHRVRIPQMGAGDSLNAAVAGGVVLYVFSREILDLSRLGGPPGLC